MTSPSSHACPAGQAMIHVIRPHQGDPAESRAALDRDELKRAARFRFPHDAAAWITWRAGLRRVLGGYLDLPPSEVPLQTGPAGKPRLAGPFGLRDDLSAEAPAKAEASAKSGGLHFNLSHSRDLAVVLVCCDGPVGIDLEPLARAPSLTECAGDFCHPRELAGLPSEPAPRAAALLSLWVAKEALLKALGTGLRFPPQNLRIDGDRAVTDPILPGLEDLKLAAPAGPRGYQMAVAVPLGVDCFGLIDR